MRRFDSCIFCAILRRRPTILTSCVASDVAAARGADTGLVRAPPRATWASRSAWTILPAGPVAVTPRRSIPSSQARARTAGEAIGRGVDDGGAAADGGADAGVRGEAAAGAGVAAGGDGGTGVGAAIGFVFVVVVPAASSTSMRISSDP